MKPNRRLVLDARLGRLPECQKDDLLSDQRVHVVRPLLVEPACFRGRKPVVLIEDDVQKWRRPHAFATPPPATTGRSYRISKIDWLASERYA